MVFYRTFSSLYPTLASATDKHRRANSLGANQTAYIVKWCVVAAVFIAVLLWFTLGHVHAKRRLQQGKKPLAYHRVCSSSLPFPLLSSSLGPLSFSRLAAK